LNGDLYKVTVEAKGTTTTTTTTTTTYATSVNRLVT
jgi:hypothetical protein